MEEQHEHELKKSASPLNMVILVLSVYVLGALLIDTFFTLSHETTMLLEYIDSAICFVFLYDFIRRFSQAENKLQFMKWGWIDLIASIPTFHYLRAGRAMRLIRIVRILRAFRSTKHLINHVYKNKTQGAFTTVSIISLLMIIFSSIAILQVEHVPNSNIKTAEDALWWAYVTLTTVGYGDKFPVTTEGRIIAGALIAVGFGLFGTFTSFLTAWFLKNTDLHNNQNT